MKYFAAALLLVFAQSIVAESVWNFDEGTGTKATANSGLVLTLRGAAGWDAQGKFKSALKLNGTTAFADAPNSTLNIKIPATIGGPQQFTLAAWINPAGLPKRSPIVLKQGATVAGVKRGFLLSAGDDITNKLFFEVFRDEAAASTKVVSTSLLKNGVWQHVAATYRFKTNGTSEMVVFIDGIAVGSTTKAVGPVLANPQPLEVGRYYWSSTYSRFFNGSIDELRILPTALTAVEIKAMAAALPAPDRLAQALPGCKFAWNYPADQLSRIENFTLVLDDVNDSANFVRVPKTQLTLDCAALKLTPGIHTLYLWAYSATEKQSSAKISLAFNYTEVALPTPVFRVQP